MSEWSIGVCGWSIDRFNIAQSLQYAGETLLVKDVQIGFFSEEVLQSADPAAIKKQADDLNITIHAPFLAFENEDYSSISSIAETGGYANDELYNKRKAHTVLAAEKAHAMGCHSIAVHSGTVPDDSSHPRFDTLLTRVGEIADELAKHNINFLLETGRESAQTLFDFIVALDRKNVFVNFDPGNFVVFGTDDPPRAITKLKDLTKIVHMKDALASDNPGETFGSKSALSYGDANIPRVVNKMKLSDYRGPVLVEADTKMFGMETLQTSIDYLKSMLD